jgi:hypothetical protein
MKGLFMLAGITLAVYLIKRLKEWSDSSMDRHFEEWKKKNKL